MPTAVDISSEEPEPHSPSAPVEEQTPPSFPITAKQATQRPTNLTESDSEEFPETPYTIPGSFAEVQKISITDQQTAAATIGPSSEHQTDWKHIGFGPYGHSHSTEKG